MAATRASSIKTSTNLFAVLSTLDARYRTIYHGLQPLRWGRKVRSERQLGGFPSYGRSMAATSAPPILTSTNLFVVVSTLDAYYITVYHGLQPLRWGSFTPSERQLGGFPSCGRSMAATSAPPILTSTNMFVVLSTLGAR
jgi:hypothetical protein